MTATFDRTSEIQLTNQVSSFLKQPKKLLINGKWVDAANGKTLLNHQQSFAVTHHIQAIGALRLSREIS